VKPCICGDITCSLELLSLAITHKVNPLSHKKDEATIMTRPLAILTI